ncbi:glycosyltransferase family 2 protein [Hyphomicrobium sp.]|uniref:glycosyltransferase family 2 protein n=1 Tax=Hyphomicrobium sp. TaxID=82 RepID=UPI0025C15D3B|nr:glycosyltransferase family 2 protein [Hyphomicrobium sp.]MCC7253992.1 glycosyltransferase family 2 protein [Hyphomicrobium sp.]
MSDIKLSICIPTYNRAKFLQKTLAHCKNDLNFPFPYEIVISDNASTDNTQEVAEDFVTQGLPIRYYKRETNGGPWPNLGCAFLRAKGAYSIYLADDDLLVPEGIGAAMAYLEQNPDVSACFTPWFLHDEVAGRDSGQFYRVDSDTKFARRDFADVFTFIFERHVFPEHAIFKTETLRSAYVPRDFCYWPFCYLAHFLDMGAVAFLQRPFYRFVTRSKVAHERPHAGHEEAMNAWDRYRGGLEYFLYVGAKRGRIGTAPAQRQKYEEMCKIFTLNRMVVALRLWVARKDFVKAYELYVRLMLGGFSNHEEVKKVRESLTLMAAVQTLAQQINAVAGVSRVILSNVADVPSLASLLYELGLDRKIEVAGEPKEHAPDLLDRTVVFTAQAADRGKFIALGYAPNLVFSESDLTDGILV